ncbi:MAG: response regulator transcription factor [Bacteroidales bacterium]|nr:response regulator transcription factor [Bacteroidales bacterium]
MKNTNTTKLIRLLVIEDNATLVLAGLRNFFRPERDLIQVSESVSCVEAALNQIDTGRFDVILLDLIIPGSSPGENISMLQHQFPGKPIVVYTSIDSNLWRKRMFVSGVHAYVHKNDSRDTLKRAIVDAFEGKIALCMGTVNTPDVGSLSPEIGENTLSITEKEILAMLSDGLRYKDIGKVLTMNDVAIETVVKRIRKKFGASSTPQLIHILTEQGLL